MFFDFVVIQCQRFPLTSVFPLAALNILNLVTRVFSCSANEVLPVSMTHEFYRRIV